MNFSNRFRRRSRASDTINETQHNGSSSDGLMGLWRRLSNSHDNMTPLPDIERAIKQGLDHHQTTYDSIRDRYKILRNNIEKVIKGFYEQRGQDLLLNQGIVTATHKIPSTGQTLLSTIAELENHILSIRLLRGENMSYETLTETIQEFESTANTFLQETSHIYQLRYGHYPEAPPQYTT